MHGSNSYLDVTMTDEISLYYTMKTNGRRKVLLTDTVDQYKNVDPDSKQFILTANARKFRSTDWGDLKDSLCAHFEYKYAQVAPEDKFTEFISENIPVDSDKEIFMKDLEKKIDRDWYFCKKSNFTFSWPKIHLSNGGTLFIIFGRRCP